MKTIQRAVADNDSLVRMPYRLYWLQGRYRNVVATSPPPPTARRAVDPAEVASRMGISPRRLGSLVAAMIHREPY